MKAGYFIAGWLIGKIAPVIPREGVERIADDDVDAENLRYHVIPREGVESID